MFANTPIRSSIRITVPAQLSRRCIDNSIARRRYPRRSASNTQRLRTL